jgi:hypothetical protein
MRYVLPLNGFAAGGRIYVIGIHVTRPEGEFNGDEGSITLAKSNLDVTLAASAGLLAVGFGAFAAHGMNDPKAVEWLHTASQYAGIHALRNHDLSLSVSLFFFPTFLSSFIYFSIYYKMVKVCKEDFKQLFI